jgi:hypothetical protein
MFDVFYVSGEGKLAHQSFWNLENLLHTFKLTEDNRNNLELMEEYGETDWILAHTEGGEKIVVMRMEDY